MKSKMKGFIGIFFILILSIYGITTLQKANNYNVSSNDRNQDSNLSIDMNINEKVRTEMTTDKVNDKILTSRDDNAYKTPEYTRISGAKAKEMMDTLEGDQFIILDVRTEPEYDSRHIEDALLIPVDELAESAEIMLPNKDTTLLVYCRSGHRSEIASHILLELGYTSVYDFGGIIEWEYDTVIDY